MTKEEEIGEVSLMEEGMRTAIARSTAAENSDMMEVGRKRKAPEELMNYSSTQLVQLRTRRRLVVKLDDSKSEEEPSSTVDPCASCCSSNGSTEHNKETPKFVDLEEDSVERPRSSTDEYESCSERKEETTTPSSEIQAEQSGDLESNTARPTTSEVNSRCRSTDKYYEMPSNAEIEEFFSAAEKEHKKHFSEKYNFDFVNEQPLEGRYSWVRVKP